LTFSVLTGANEGYVMSERGIFGVWLPMKIEEDRKYIGSALLERLAAVGFHSCAVSTTVAHP
jgi:hypothetical protein